MLIGKHSNWMEVDSFTWGSNSLPNVLQHGEIHLAEYHGLGLAGAVSHLNDHLIQCALDEGHRSPSHPQGTCRLVGKTLKTPLVF